MNVVEIERATSDGKFKSLGVASPGGLFVACIHDDSAGWSFDRIIHVKTGLAPEAPRDYGADVAKVIDLMTRLETIPGFDGTAVEIERNAALCAETRRILRAYSDALYAALTAVHEESAK